MRTHRIVYNRSTGYYDLYAIFPHPYVFDENSVVCIRPNIRFNELPHIGRIMGIPGY